MEHSPITLPNVPLAQRLALTLPECAALTGLKSCALRAAIWAGELAFIRAGKRGRYLIRREASVTTSWT